MIDPAIREAMEAERIFMSDPDTYLRYVNRQMAIMDYQSGMEAATEKGREIGEKIGEERGERRIARLMNLLLENGQIDEAREAARSEEMREKLFEKYGIA